MTPGSPDWDRARAQQQANRLEMLDQLRATDLPVLGVAEASSSPRVCRYHGGSDGVQEIGLRYGELRDQASPLLDVIVARGEPQEAINDFLSPSGHAVAGPEPLRLDVEGDCVDADLYRAGPFWAAEVTGADYRVQLTGRYWPTDGIRLVKIPITEDLFPPLH